MSATVIIPTTGSKDIEKALDDLADSVIKAGCDALTVHARKAWLSGLSPKENRDVPPLDYPLVYALKRARPELTIVINGGIPSLEEAETHLAHVDGVMLGRTAYQNPALLAEVDARFFGESARDINEAVAAYAGYAASQLAEGVPLAFTAIEIGTPCGGSSRFNLRNGNTSGVSMTCFILAFIWYELSQYSMLLITISI